MTGFSEFLINNMKSSLAPEDLKLFKRNSKYSSVNKTELTPVEAEIIEQKANTLKIISNKQDDDHFNQECNDDSESDNSESTKYNEMIRPKPNIKNRNRTSSCTSGINSYSRYRIVANKIREESKKKPNKVNTVRKTDQKNKNIKNLTYDKSWKNLANRYDDKSPKITTLTPERKIKSFMTKTLEKTKTIVINGENKEKTIKLEAHLLNNKLTDSEATNSNLSKKVTTNPIYLSDSHIKKDDEKEAQKSVNHHSTMSQRFSTINIDDLKPINASFSVMDNLDGKNFNEQVNKSEYYEEETINLDYNDNYNKLKYEEITTKKRTANNHKKLLQPTVKFEINQLLTENDCKILKNLDIKNDNETESDGEYDLNKHISELHVNSGLFKALKILRIVFNKSHLKKNSASDENYQGINSIRLKKKKRKKKNTPSIKGTVRINNKLNTNLDLKRKQILKKKVSFNKKTSSVNSTKSKLSKFAKSNQKLSMREQESNIYSNNMTLTQESRNKNMFSIKNGVSPAKNSKPESNYKYRSKLNPNSINLRPYNDQSNHRDSSNLTHSSMANSSNSTTFQLNSLDKDKLKHKEKLLSNWDKVIKKASNDPQSLKQLLKTNSEKALDSKKVKSPIKLNREDIGDKSHTSLLDKINNRILQSKNNFKKREDSKENKPENINKTEEELDKNTEKRIDEMLLNAKTAGKQGELVKNLFSYLNNYGDDGFTIKANLTSQSTPFVKSEVIFNNQLNSPSSENPENKNSQSSKSLLSASSTSSLNKKNDKINSNTPDHQNYKIKNNQKSNFPYYLKCCVDKKPGPSSTIGSRCSETTKICQNKPNNSPIAPNSKIVDDNKDNNKQQTGMFPFKKDKNCMLDIDQLIQTLEGDGQVEFLKKKLSLYIKSKNIINSTSTISQDFTSNAASSATVSLDKKEISYQIENKNINKENNLNSTFMKLNINEACIMENKSHEHNDNSVCKKEAKEETKYKNLDVKMNNQSVDPSTLNTLAISSDSFSSTTTLDSPSLSQINPIVKLLNPTRDNELSIESEKSQQIEIRLKENKFLNNLNKKETEMEMFYFDPTESPARKTLKEKRTEKATKGFPKHLVQNSSTPNPEHHIQSDENTQTLSKFYFSPDSKTVSPKPDYTFKPPELNAEIMEIENHSIKPSFQYQHQNIFKTILRSKHFQTLRRICENCQTPKNKCKCKSTHLEDDQVLKAASKETEMNKSPTKSNHNTKPKSKLQKLMHEFYLPSNGDIKKEKPFEEINKDLEIFPALKNKTLNKIKTRTKEKFKNQMKEWANSLNIGTSPTTDSPSVSTKIIEHHQSNEDSQKLNTLKVNLRLRSRVKKQLKQYEQNSIVGTKKKRSKRVEWRPLVKDQMPKSSKQILQEISLIAKNKAKYNEIKVRNDAIIKRKNEQKADYEDEENIDDELIDTTSITLNNDDTIITTSNAQSFAQKNFKIASNIANRKADYYPRRHSEVDRTKAVTTQNKIK